MKRVIQIAASIILSCLFFTQEGFAQTKKLSEYKTDLTLPSYLYQCKGSSRFFEEYDVKLTYKYYYDDNYNKIKEGPIKISGSVENSFGITSIHTICTANVNIIGNYSNGELNGAMSATYNEQAKGMLANESCSLTLKTTFKNDVMVGSLTMDSSINIEGKKEKQWWHITLDSNGKPKSIDCQAYGSKVKASYNDKGEATGVLVYDGETVKFTRGVATSFFKRKNGEECACGAEQKALLDKYLNGVYTEDDLFRAGYILASYKYPAIGFDEWALRCLNLRESNLGNFGSISMYIKQLEQLDILTYDDLVSYIDPEKAEGTFDWSDMQYDSNDKQVRLNGKWYYANKSDVDRFEHVVDSIARVESSEFADFLFASQCTSDIYKTNKFKGRGFTLSYDGRNYENLVGLGKSSFKLDTLVRNQEYKHERVYDVHGVVTYDKGQNHGLYKMKVVLSITPNHLELSNPRWWVKVSKYEDIPTQWDKYRELKVKVIKQHEAIVSNQAQYDQPSYTAYTTFCQGYDLNASEDYEQSMTVLNNLDLVIKNFLEYTKKREKLEIDHSKLLYKLAAYKGKDILPLYKKYFDSLDYTWTPENGFDVLKKPRRTIDATSIFLAKRKTIDANDAKLKDLLTLAKTMQSIYEPWRQNVDLSWTPAVENEKLDAVLDKQAAYIEILSKPNIKDIDKRIKRSKLTDLTAVIQFVNSGYESAPAADNSAEIENPKKEAVVKKVREEKAKEVKVKETKVREYRNKGLIHTFQFDAQLPISNGTAKCFIFGGEYMIGYRFSDKLTLSGGVGFSYTTDYSEHLDHLKYQYSIASNSYVNMGGGEWLNVKDVRNVSGNTSSIAIPIFVNVKYFFTKGAVQPFVSASAGAYVLPFIFPKTDVGVGCNFRIGRRFNAYALLSLDTAVAPRREFVANYPDEDDVYDMNFNDGADFLTPSIKVGFSF